MEDRFFNCSIPQTWNLEPHSSRNPEPIGENPNRRHPKTSLRNIAQEGKDEGEDGSLRRSTAKNLHGNQEPLSEEGWTQSSVSGPLGKGASVAEEEVFGMGGGGGGGTPSEVRGDDGKVMIKRGGEKGGGGKGGILKKRALKKETVESVALPEIARSSSDSSSYAGPGLGW